MLFISISGVVKSLTDFFGFTR